MLLLGVSLPGDYIIPAMNMDTCPRCGDPCDLNARDSWAKVVRRRVFEGSWMMPWTWGRWSWEYRQLGHLDQGGFDYRAAMRNAKIK